jgi:hypothetical protein
MTTESSAPVHPATDASPASVQAAAATGIQSIVTHRSIAAPAQRVWDGLQFYEELDQEAPFLLRLLLPRPARQVASAQVQGEATTLPYEGGHYARRITKLEPPLRYEFEVIDQQLKSDRGVLLLSGAYTLRETKPGLTDLAITTRYVSRIRPRWLADPIEAMLCRRLHRHLLDSIEALAGLA